VSRKQQLLKRHRRNKRLGLLAGLVLLVALGCSAGGGCRCCCCRCSGPPMKPGLPTTCSMRPARTTPTDFGEQTREAGAPAGWLLRTDAALQGDETLVLEVGIKSGWLGRFLDPRVELLGGAGRDGRPSSAASMACVTSTSPAWPSPWRRARCACAGAIAGCRAAAPVDNPGRRAAQAPGDGDRAPCRRRRAGCLWLVQPGRRNLGGDPDRWRDRSRALSADGPAKAEAARLKGRLRAWDSIAVPRWAGVPERVACSWAISACNCPPCRRRRISHSVRAKRTWPISACSASFNPFPLPADADGAPTWHNLLADLRACWSWPGRSAGDAAPELDPHPDHICAQAAVREALQGLAWQPQTLLCYANHLHDNDRWPMGDSGDGVALPPQLSAEAWAPCSLVLDPRPSATRPWPWA
jgi:hypothetical protein